MSLPVRARATARVEAVAPEGGEGLLVEFLRAYRDAVQLVVNEVWKQDKVPSTKKLHVMFYGKLRALGFRAHHVSEIYKRAREVVEATKKNKGSKPILKKLVARIHQLDYNVDFNTKTLRVAVLNGYWVELKLKWYSYLDKYLDGSWRLGEIQVGYRDGRIFIYLTFSKEVQLGEPKTIMGVDLNFNNITYTVVDLSGNLVSMGAIPFRGLSRALHFKKLAEELQKRCPKSWRFLRWAGRARARWLKRARNILLDSPHHVAKRLVEIAKGYSTVIALEDLKKLRGRANGGRLSWELQLWCYRRVQGFVEYKALVEGIKVFYADPKGTSKTSPNGKPLAFINYRFVKLGDSVTTRDVVASWNLALRGLKQMRGCRVRLTPDSSVDAGMRTRPNTENPGVYSQVFTDNYK